MCGEIDEQVLIGQEMLGRAQAMARRLGVTSDAIQGSATPPSGLSEAAGRAAYMESVFSDGLTRALDDIAGAQEDEKIDALAAQAIAFARLAGFLAGQLPPEADLYRAVIEAATDGHGEPRAMVEADRAHHHHHDHYHHH